MSLDHDQKIGIVTLGVASAFLIWYGLSRVLPDGQNAPIHAEEQSAVRQIEKPVAEEQDEYDFIYEGYINEYLDNDFDGRPDSPGKPLRTFHVIYGQEENDSEIYITRRHVVPAAHAFHWDTYSYPERFGITFQNGIFSIISKQIPNESTRIQEEKLRYISGNFLNKFIRVYEEKLRYTSAHLNEDTISGINRAYYSVLSAIFPDVVIPEATGGDYPSTLEDFLRPFQGNNVYLEE